MKIAVNAASAKMGGAATYLKNLLPEMARQLPRDGEIRIVVWAGSDLPEASQWGTAIEVRPVPQGVGEGGLRRLWFDQVTLPKLLRRERFDVLFSSASLGPLNPPCPQVLLVRNPIYFSPEYERRMTSASVRWRLRVQRWLTLAAARRSRRVLFPTRAMMEMVAAYAGASKPTWAVAPYGINHRLFTPATSGHSVNGGPVRLLHVSHYCDQKDVGGLLQAVDLLDRRTPGRYHLTLTAGFASLREEDNPHCPFLAEDRRLFQALQNRGVATDLGSVPYARLPQHYREADLFVFPSYTESFGHPLVEAMACGLPIIAADVAVNREMCGDAAMYARAFHPGGLAASVETLAGDARQRRLLRSRGLARAAEFRWERHACLLLDALGCQPLEPLRKAA